jgi:anthranilate synthase/aminodeoxychorismate synthase-like glutamine amidotransferase
VRTVILDNYDSFTFNLYQYLGELEGQRPLVLRNDDVTLDGLERLNPGRIVISPGPGRPDDPGYFGVCHDAILALGPRLPLLGICLGHQGVVHAFGGEVVGAPEVMHGKASRVHHNGDPIFRHVPGTFEAMRYHSLVGRPQSIPDCLRVIARTDDGVVMGVRHRAHPIYGLQFHPESVGTPAGKTVLRNFLRLAPGAADERTRSQAIYGLRSDAVVLHCPARMRLAPNPFRHVWAEACRRFFADAALGGGFSDGNDLTIVAYNTSTDELLLEACLRRLGLRRPVVLGRQLERWQAIHKISLLAEYLDRTHASEYIMCLDGDGALVVGDPALALERFRELDCEMLFCGSRGERPRSPDCWEFENEVSEVPDPWHRHLSAGAYIGRSAFVRERLREILAAHAARDPWCFSPSGFDDQLAWSHMHIRHHPDIRIDAACRVFLRFDEDR